MTDPNTPEEAIRDAALAEAISLSERFSGHHLTKRLIALKSAHSPAPRVSDAEIMDEFDKVSAFAEDPRGRAWAYLDQDSALAFGRALLERK